MRISRKRAVVAMVAARRSGLSACGSDGSSNDNGVRPTSPSFRNGASATLASPSDAKGGTLKFGFGAEWGDSTIDPGETYYGYSWNMLRNFARTLVMFKSELGPRRAPNSHRTSPTDLGTASDGGKTWTYTLKQGLKYEDGKADHGPRTSKYAVLRSTDKKTFKTAPEYLKEHARPVPRATTGPYQAART